MPDVTIIGGGPAACVAAIALARSGWAVTLIEQHKFPRDKVCGECLSSLGIEVLSRLGLRNSLEELEPVVLHRTVLHAPDGATADISLPSPMWGISRFAMDARLLAEAQLAGARVLQPARCESIETVPQLCLRVRDLATNTVFEMKPFLALLADGKGMLGGARPAATGDLGVKSHFTGIDGPGDAIQLFGVNGHYGGVAPIEGDRWNFAMSVPADRVALHRGNLDSLFDAMLKENRGLRLQFKRAKRISPWLASPLPRFAVANAWPDRVVSIGNAAAAIEPIGGEGMGLAMRSAEIVAQALTTQAVPAPPNVFDSTLDFPSLQKQLQNNFRNLWRARRAACRMGAIVISAPRFAETILPIAQSNPGLAALVLRWMGKV